GRFEARLQEKVRSRVRGREPAMQSRGESRGLSLSMRSLPRGCSRRRQDRRRKRRSKNGGRTFVLPHTPELLSEGQTLPVVVLQSTPARLDRRNRARVRIASRAVAAIVAALASAVIRRGDNALGVEAARTLSRRRGARIRIAHGAVALIVAIAVRLGRDRAGTVGEAASAFRRTSLRARSRTRNAEAE